jgi:hypothetical protein
LRRDALACAAFAAAPRFAELSVEDFFKIFAEDFLAARVTATDYFAHPPSDILSSLAVRVAQP